MVVGMRWLVVLVLAGCPSPTPSPKPTPPPAKPVASEKPAVKPEPAHDPAPATDPDHPIVALHNAKRAEHCAPPLEWSDKLAKVAQKWANHLRDHGCVFGHSDTMYGENLAAGTSGVMDDATVVDMWYREVDKYKFKHPGFDGNTGHFTQLVWVATTHVGCGRSTCNGNDIIVCNYDPAGNVMTYFEDNVLPKSCKKRDR